MLDTVDAAAAQHLVEAGLARSRAGGEGGVDADRAGIEMRAVQRAGAAVGPGADHVAGQRACGTECLGFRLVLLLTEKGVENETGVSLRAADVTAAGTGIPEYAATFIRAQQVDLASIDQDAAGAGDLERMRAAGVDIDDAAVVVDDGAGSIALAQDHGGHAGIGRSLFAQIDDAAVDQL